MIYGLATKSFLASDKGLTMAFVGLFSGSVTYLVVAFQGSSGPAAGAAHTMTLVSAAQDFAVLGGEEGLRRIAIGAVVPGLGQVARIERRDGRWAVIFANGKVLTTATSSAAATDD